MTHSLLTIEDTYGTDEEFFVASPLYDISQKVKEANEALKNDSCPFDYQKENKVKFSKNLVDYEPEEDISSDDGYDELTDVESTPIGCKIVGDNQEAESPAHQFKPLILQNKTEEVKDRNSNNTQTSYEKAFHDVVESSKAMCTRENEIIEEYETCGNDNADDGKIFLRFDNNNSDNFTPNANEISFANLNEILNDVIQNKKYKCSSEQTETVSRNVNYKDSKGAVSLQIKSNENHLTSKHSEAKTEHNNNDQERKEEFTKEAEYYNISSTLIHKEENKSIDKEKLIQTNINGISSNLKIVSINGNNNSMTDYSKKCLYSNAPEQSSYGKHIKWYSSRLPKYDGLNSEYGLSAEMLEERKRKAEIVNQLSRERKNDEIAKQEQKRRENDLSYKMWIKSKESEKMKTKDEITSFVFDFGDEKAETFNQWLKRKTKEKRGQKKLENLRKNYEAELLKRSKEESQQAFKRWLHSKMRKWSKSGKPCKKTHSFNQKRSYKNYYNEKNLEMRNTCRIYLGQ